MSAGVAADRRQLSGHIEVGQIWFTHSRKGERDLDQTPRGRGSGWGLGRVDIPREWVLLAYQLTSLTDLESDPRSGLVAVPVGRQRPSAGTYERSLLPRLRIKDTPRLLIIGHGGRLGTEACLARRAGATYEQARRRGFWTPAITRMRGELLNWLRPFRGVASRYLANYLFWFGAGGPAFRVTPL